VTSFAGTQPLNAPRRSEGASRQQHYRLRLAIKSAPEVRQLLGATGEGEPSRERAPKVQPASRTPSTSAPAEANAVTAPQVANHKVDLERW